MSVLATALPALLRHSKFFFPQPGNGDFHNDPIYSDSWVIYFPQTDLLNKFSSKIGSLLFYKEIWSLFLQDLANCPCKLSLICSSMCRQLATARWASTSKMFLLREKNRYLKHRSSSYIQIMRNKMIAVQLMVLILPNGCLKNYSLLMMNLLSRLQQRYRLRNSV